jgi:monoamine oxidase
VSRSPLFDSLRQALRIAAVAAREEPGAPPLDELIDMARMRQIEKGRTRRLFLRDSALATAGLAIAGAGCSTAPPAANMTPGGPATPAARAGAPRIAIVGGGMAGLNTAYKLQKAGLASTIYEGANRTGGRMFSATDLLGTGLVT